MAGNGSATPKLLLTPAEASRALAISPRKLWSLTANGEIPCIRFGRCKRYALEDLQSEIDRRKQGATIDDPYGKDTV